MTPRLPQSQRRRGRAGGARRRRDLTSLCLFLSSRVRSFVSSLLPSFLPSFLALSSVTSVGALLLSLSARKEGRKEGRRKGWMALALHRWRLFWFAIRHKSGERSKLVSRSHLREWKMERGALLFPVVGRVLTRERASASSCEEFPRLCRLSTVDWYSQAPSTRLVVIDN